MVDRDIMSWIKNVVYEDRLGRDFDHKEVTLILGKNGKRRNENIYKGTITDIRAKYVGTCAMYDILNEHLRVPIDRVRLQLGQIESKIRELNRNIGLMGGELDIKDERIEETWEEIEGIINNMPEETDMLDREFICDYRTLYEVLIMEIKNRLLGIQADNKRREVRGKKQY